MASIDDLKSLLNHQISGGKMKLNVHVNDAAGNDLNCIMLFYDAGSEFITAGRKAAYYDTKVMVVVRHSNYDQARASCFEALEYINSHRKTISGVYWKPDGVPSFQGEDDSRGGFVWSFSISMKGGK